MLTQFEIFLGEKGLLDQFMHNLINLEGWDHCFFKSDFGEGDSFGISSAFIWDRTPEGGEFWNEIDDEYREYICENLK